MSSILLAANWKMNGDAVMADRLVQMVLDGSSAMPGIGWLICPPAVYLAGVNQALQASSVFLGAQDVIRSSERGIYQSAECGDAARCRRYSCDSGTFRV